MENINNTDNQETIFWAITIFCKKELENLKYLVVQNTETWNISFISWAQEIEDQNTIDTAKREVKEELNIDPEKYKLITTSVKHEFVFWPNKKERAWKNGSYQVYRADWSDIESINHTKELKMATWMTKEDVLKTLSFDDLKKVFEEAIWEIKL
jgi:8-oxo-dGTP pyrophosphatase MutT (NUDIX family)